MFVALGSSVRVEDLIRGVIVASANEITAAICTVTGERPATVCDTRGVASANAKMGIQQAGSP